MNSKIFKTVLILLLFTLNACSVNEINPLSNIKNTNNTNLYVNKDYSFTLTLPQSFADYNINIQNNDTSNNITTEQVIIFGIKTHDINWPNINGYVEVFRVSVYTLDHWKRFLTSEHDIPNIFATTEDYVYTWYKMPTHPKDVIITEQDFNNLIQSFNLTQGTVIENLQPAISTTTPQGDI